MFRMFCVFCICSPFGPSALRYVTGVGSLLYVLVAENKPTTKNKRNARLCKVGGPDGLVFIFTTVLKTVPVKMYGPNTFPAQTFAAP